MRYRSIVLGLAIFAMLSGCSLKQYDPTADWSVDKLYEEAKNAMDTAHYEQAAKYQTKLLARFPSSKYAQQALLDLGYAYSKNGDSDKAETTFNNYIRIYPDSPFTDYAYYMKGVAAYQQNVNIFSRLSPSNLAQTDPEKLRRAFNQFAELVKRYPKSQYAEDAKYRMLFLKNMIAQHELEIADHYLRQGVFLAAANRAKDVVKFYNGTPSVPYALALMVRAYRELGQKQLADDAMRVLQLNFANLVNKAEIQHYLSGDVQKQVNLWDMLNEQPKI